MSMTTTGNRRPSVIPRSSIGITRGDLYATVAGAWWGEAARSSHLTVVRRVVPIERRDGFLGSDVANSR
jgi:hypothetical protein